ncbi:polysaccharide biosynthesis/export family protein [Flaviramulus aquimarinus]|uniref:Polysaccharide biosynthesis/export family protein n=1 Tax=Flaviramulus aquimarinus TaxID=1170456 RepID=A0ABP9FDA7_9FLAO
MNKFVKRKRFSILYILTVFLLSYSCGSKKDVVYFQNAKDFETLVDTDSFTPKFKVNDIVSIYVSTFDLEAAEPFNLKKGQSASGGLEYIDYLIDVDGNIDYPVLGKIKLLGLTVEEGKVLLKKKLADYLKDPIVNIRILNFRISVHGEVNSPGIYEVPGERVTLLQAIAMAGDLRIKGKRENVLVIRDFNGSKTFTRIDLTNKELFNSPVYYLTQNDIVYVEPNKSAISDAYLDARVNTAISIASILITTAIVLITRN